MLIFWLGIGLLTAIALLLVLWPLLRASKDKRRAWGLMVAVVLLLPSLALGIYLSLGHSQAVAQKKQQQAIVAEIPDIIAKLKSKLEANPDPYGWLLLGRLYLKNQDYADAEVALSQAKQLAPDNTDILLAYAQADYLQHNETLGEEAQTALLQILRSDPKQVDALNLLGLGYYKQNNFAQALQYWQQALAQLAPDSEGAKMLEQQIALAQQQVKTEATPQGLSLQIEVELGPDLQKLTSPEDTVFVYAQSEKSPMPLAVKRLKVKDLPTQITLDESMAMVPDMSLASAQEVTVTARISKSGNAIAQSGDLIGQRTQVDVRHPPRGLRIMIDSLKKE